MIKWKDDFSCNHEEIDNQHKELINICEELFYLLKESKDYDKYDALLELFNRLKTYTVEHFKYEELLMIKHNFEGYEEHKKQHERFVFKIQELEKSDLDIEQNRITMEVLEFVVNWISGHILSSDKKYSVLF